jgi:N-acetylglucosamine-6-phosphate deacetylase
MLRIYGRRYDNGEPVCIETRGDRIASIVPAWPAGSIADWPYVAPGLFDLQINGHGGVWFSDEALTPELARQAITSYLRHGVTRLCPTLVTNSFAAIAAGLKAIRAACEGERWVDRMVPGIHVEGPYISPEDGPRGAHPKEHVRPCDWQEFCKWQEIAGGRIRLLTIAPESPGAVQFTRQVTATGVTLAIGHTAASPEQIAAVVDAGATLSTHLGNGSAAMVHRHRNHITAQLGEPRLTASLILDGCHLPGSLVRTMIRVKTPRQIVLTCDASGWAGCPPGLYTNSWGDSEILEDGRLVVAGQRELLAGSAFETDICVGTVMDHADVSLKEAVDMASRHPARLLGFEQSRLRRGSLADLFVFRREPGSRRLAVSGTVAAGNLRFGTLWDGEAIL